MKVPVPLRLKFIMGILLTAVAGFLFIAIVGKNLALVQIRRTDVKKLYKDANYIAATYSVNDGNITQVQIESMAYSSEAEIWIIDTDGTLTAFSGNAEVPEQVTGFQPSAGIEGHYMIGTFYGCFSEEYLSVYAPLTLHIAPQGYVILHYPTASIDTEADSQVLLAYMIYAIFVALLLLLYIGLEITVIGPAHKLQAAAYEYTNGNLSYPAAVKTGDEYQDLSQTMQELARQLGSSANDQHRFLANISHDFRSPLTSIRGYLVAIQDGTIPPELQGKYLDIVISETARLTKLANGLLDMTQLENGILLEKTDFDINSLIREVLPTYEGRSREKDLDFNITFESEAQYVRADKARIQQVLHNLIDNALKFSNPHSGIDISTHLHNDKVFVSVQDHGIGIEKENINKIWERFYKTDASRGKDKKGTGLGLSIVREIIQAHKQNIDVISTPGVGTEFIFTLQSTEI